MVEDSLSYYRKIDGETKKEVLSCIFDEKIHFDDEKNAAGNYQ